MAIVLQVVDNNEARHHFPIRNCGYFLGFYLFSFRIEFMLFGICGCKRAMCNFIAFQSKLNSFPSDDNINKVGRDTPYHILLERGLQCVYEHGHHFFIMQRWVYLGNYFPPSLGILHKGLRTFFHHVL